MSVTPNYIYLMNRSGVDPAARDYILHTILSNYNEHATILISTHLISDIENILDRVLFIQNGELVLNATVDDIRSEQKKSVDALFRGGIQMLGKIIKYDMKAMNRFLIIIHAFPAYICIFYPYTDHRQTYSQQCS